MTIVMTAFTQFRVAKLAAGSRVPAKSTITISAAASAGATSLTITASPIYLEAGRELTVGAESFVVAENVPVGGTVIQLEEPLVAPIAVNTAINNVIELFEFLGGESVDLSTDLNMVAIRNFKSGAWIEQSKVSTGVTLSVDGSYHLEDKAISNVIRPAVFTLTAPEVYVELVRPNGESYRGAFIISDYSESMRVDDVLRASFTLSSQGAIIVPAPQVLTV